MRLTAKPLINWCNVNQFSFANQWTVRSGDPVTLYFQLVDTDQAIQGNNSGYGVFSGIAAVGTTAGLRYLLGVGTSNQPYGVIVTFPSVDRTKVLQYVATQADPNDSSLWQVTLPASAIPAGGNVQFAVQQGSNINRFSVLNMLAVEPINGGSC
jgi:hypothetical protein